VWSLGAIDVLLDADSWLDRPLEPGGVEGLVDCSEGDGFGTITLSVQDRLGSEKFVTIGGS